MLTWDQLATEVGGEVYGRTMHCIISDALDYKKHWACIEGWVSDRAKAHKQEWAKLIFKKYPKPEDWHCVRFFDKVHFGYKLEGQLRMIRRLGILYCYDCI